MPKDVMFHASTKNVRKLNPEVERTSVFKFLGIICKMFSNPFSHLLTLMLGILIYCTYRVEPQQLCDVEIPCLGTIVESLSFLWKAIFFSKMKLQIEDAV